MKKTDYGLYLKRLMEEQGVSQYALAARAGVPQPTIQRILSGETRNPKMDTIRQLLSALGVRTPTKEHPLFLFFERQTGGARESTETHSVLPPTLPSKESIDLAIAIESLPTAQRAALRAAVDSLTHLKRRKPKDCKSA